VSGIDLTDAVEAAAREDWRRDPERVAWESLAPEMREYMRRKVARVITAAAPLIEAQVRADERARIEEALAEATIDALQAGRKTFRAGLERASRIVHARGQA